jgi:hypothetical protein
MSLKCDIQFFSFSILMYQVVLYQCVNLDHVVCCFIVFHHKWNISTLQTYSSCIECVGVDLEWILKWQIWSFRLSRNQKIQKLIKDYEMKDKQSCVYLYKAI